MQDSNPPTESQEQGILLIGDKARPVGGYFPDGQLDSVWIDTSGEIGMGTAVVITRAALAKINAYVAEQEAKRQGVL